jgi:hypothetical protein
MNLGQLLGPLVGGALYQYGGFYLPFVTMGALQAGMGLVSMVTLKEIPGRFKQVWRTLVFEILFVDEIDIFTLCLT